MLNQTKIGDKYLLIAVLALIVLSVPFSLSASGRIVFESLQGNYLSVLTKQLVYSVLAIFIIFFFAYSVSYKKLNKYSPHIFLFVLFLLVLTVFAGSTHNEARRALDLRLIPFSLQTAAFAKPILVIFVASLLTKELKDQHIRTRNTKTVILVTAITAALTLSHGLSTTLIMITTILFMMIVVRTRVNGLSKMILAGIGIVVLYFFAAELLGLPHRVTTWTNRMTSWWYDSCDTITDSNFQACLSKSAIAGSGFWGSGPGQSPLRFKLPEAHSDFIFAFIVDEAGIIGALVLIILYGVILFRGIQIARKALNPFSMLLAFGLTTLIMIQVHMNIGVALGVLPVTGQPLPFVSRGGSSLIASAASIGILLNISKSHFQELNKRKRKKA